MSDTKAAEKLSPAKQASLAAKLARIDAQQKRAQSTVEKATDQRVAVVREMREGGMTFDAIGSAIGVSGQAIFEMLNRANRREKNTHP